jgi:beta-glucosidase
MVGVAGRHQGSAGLHERCAAGLMAWLPGEEGAGAIAQILVVDECPGGKLPISYPRTAGHVPTFYGHKVSGGRSHWKGDYADAPAGPLYPFGHGLSYTSFALSDASLADAEVPWHGTIRTRVTITNTGAVAGDEVIQLYVRDPVATVTRPVLELKAFARVPLAPGEARTVTFDTPVGQLGFHGRDLAHVVEPGRIDVFVGTSSAELIDVGHVTVTADPSGPPQKQFDGSVTVAEAAPGQP